jgi:hypothetical protein
MVLLRRRSTGPWFARGTMEQRTMTRGVLGHEFVSNFSRRTNVGVRGMGRRHEDSRIVALKILQRSAHVCGLSYSDPEACFSN